jgi:hypothetical protein
VSVHAAQLGIDFSARSAPAKPKRPPRDHAVDERTKLALELCLRARHDGRERAATWEVLRAEINAEGEGQEGALFVTCVRRLQEAAEDLAAEGKPVVGTSADGVWWARTAAEVELALDEQDKRARKSLMKRGRLRRIWRELLGQEALGAVEDQTA